MATPDVLSSVAGRQGGREGRACRDGHSGRPVLPRHLYIHVHRRYGRSRTSVCSATLGHPVHRARGTSVMDARNVAPTAGFLPTPDWIWNAEISASAGQQMLDYLV